MRRLALVALAATLFLGVSDLAAQAKANFAGTWTRVDDPAAAAAGAGARGGRGGGGMFGLGMAATITQDAKTLTVTRTTQAGEVKTVYNLDGTESKNQMAGRGGAAATEAVSKTKWDGNKLVITTSVNFGGNPIETSMSMSLDATGNLLVESTTPGRQGGGTPTTTKTTYKKS
jgi:hypothetical protein